MFIVMNYAAYVGNQMSQFVLDEVLVADELVQEEMFVVAVLGAVLGDLAFVTGCHLEPGSGWDFKALLDL